MTSQPEITRLLHVSLLVHDLARARQFYEQVLGLSPSPLRPQLGFAGVWYDVGEQQIHLLTGAAPGQISNDGAPGGRDRHIAFAVANLEQLVSTLKEHEIAFTRSASGRRALFCRDPEGNALEFSELSSTPAMRPS